MREKRFEEAFLENETAGTSCFSLLALVSNSSIHMATHRHMYRHTKTRTRPVEEVIFINLPVTFVMLATPLGPWILGPDD